MNQRIRVTTEDRGLSGYQTPEELREVDEIKSVVRAQRRKMFPHIDPDDKRSESSVGRLCLTQRGHEGCFEAGLRYGEAIRRFRLVKGLPVRCILPSGGEPLSEEDK